MNHQGYIFRSVLLFLAILLSPVFYAACQVACKNPDDPAVCRGYTCGKVSRVCLTSCNATEQCDVSRGYSCSDTKCVCDKAPQKSLAGGDCDGDDDCNTPSSDDDDGDGDGDDSDAGGDAGAKPAPKDIKRSYVCLEKQCYAGCNFSCITSSACNKNEIIRKIYKAENQKFDDGTPIPLSEIPIPGEPDMKLVVKCMDGDGNELDSKNTTVVGTCKITKEEKEQVSTPEEDTDGDDAGDDDPIEDLDDEDLEDDAGSGLSDDDDLGDDDDFGDL